jgi:DNA-directed RNA polymerase subunit RPC12/RpoP
MNNDFDITYDGHDIQCPNCLQHLGVENWRTEYGNPTPGEYDIECPACRHNFRIDVQPTVAYTVLY